MTRSRRIAIALFTALSLFFASWSTGVHARPGEGRVIRRGAPAAVALVSLRAAVSAQKVVDLHHDAALDAWLPPAPLVEIAPAVVVASLSFTVEPEKVARVSTIAARARAPPAR